MEYTDSFLNILNKSSGCVKFGFLAMFDVYESSKGVLQVEGRKVAEGEIDCTQYECI